MASVVKIIIDAENRASSALKEADDSLGSLAKKITGFGGGALAATAAIAGVGLAIKTAFDMGEQGAKIDQTAQSFDYLMQRVGVAPDLLNELRDASKGTVDDLTLMKSTLLLAAGAQGELESALIASMPKLMEYAKAANKLNPTLGDTSFMLESISTGIKRASPLILDNLGLTIKMEDAYRKYGAQIGKAADQLTIEEQKLAILNATMDAGEVLIQQVGGTTDSAADSFARLETATANITDAFKVGLYPAIADIAEAFSKLLTSGADEIEALKQLSQDTRNSSKSWDEYSQSIYDAFRAAGFHVKITGDEIKVIQQTGTLLEDVTEKYGILDKVTLNAIRTGSSLIENYNGVAGAQAQMNVTMQESVEIITKVGDSMSKISLAAGLDGKIQKSWEDYAEKSRTATEETAKLKAELAALIAEGIDPASGEIVSLQEKIDDQVSAQKKLQEQVNKTTREFIYQKAAAYMDEEASLELAKAMGVLSEADYNLVKQIMTLTDSYDTDRSGVISLDEATGVFIGTLNWLANMTKVAEENSDALADSYNKQKDSVSALEEQTYQLGLIQSALSAGITGSLTESMQSYQQIADEAVASNKLLVAQYLLLSSQGIPDTAEEMVNLKNKIQENNKAQVEALANMRKMTAEMIYQQASQGLSADAALELAKQMGLISDQDYEVAISVQRLRDAFDANRDGMISAAEGAYQYAAAIAELHAQVIALQNSGMVISSGSLLSGIELPWFGGSSAIGSMLDGISDNISGGISALETGSSSAIGSMLDGISNGITEFKTESVYALESLISGIQQPENEIVPAIDALLKGLPQLIIGANPEKERSSDFPGSAGAVTIVYSPTFSSADQYELTQILAPIIRNVMSGM